jgi:two-component system, OmpR family, response regulator
MKHSILVVDDDPHIRDVVAFALEKAGMQPIEAKDGKDALHQFRHHAPQLVVLDISMPEMDGLEVCREIRKTDDTPILFLSSRDEEIDRIIGLEIGGDDYVTKPFSPRELVARVNVILKRSRKEAPMPAAATTWTHGELTLNDEEHSVRFKTTDVELTATEFAIVKALLQHPKRVYERDAIMHIAYPHNIHVSDRTIDSHIRHVRAKFAALGCESVIDTVRGVGYRIGICS